MFKIVAIFGTVTALLVAALWWCIRSAVKKDLELHNVKQNIFAMQEREALDAKIKKYSITNVRNALRDSLRD